MRSECEGRSEVVIHLSRFLNLERPTDKELGQPAERERERVERCFLCRSTRLTTNGAGVGAVPMI